jgi:hypothetical protein
MLRSRQTLAVIFSLVLVFGALWVRYVNAKDTKQLEIALIAEDNKRQETQEALSKELLRNADETSLETETLTQTDLIGRQLFTDYMSLSSKGQATPENLNDLASKYVTSIQSIDATTLFTISDLKIVEDSDITLKSYGQSLFGIRSKYQNSIKEMTSGMVSIQPGTNQFTTFMKNVSLLYKQSAEEMENLPVPASLAPYHLKLINNYLSSANAANQLTDISKDPIGSYASINTQAKNGKEEVEILNSIQTSLSSKGIFFETTS